MSNREHPQWTEIKVAMLIHVPFFSSLLFDMMNVQIGKFPHVFGDRVPTAATDGKTIYLDEDFLSKQQLPESVFLVCHEIGHAMFMHMARAKKYMDIGFDGDKFDPRRWNYAADYIINDMLIASGIGTMPKGGLHDSKYPHTMSAEEVYRALQNNMPKGGGGSGDDNGNDGGTMDVHLQADNDITEAEMKRAIQTAVDQSKAMGKCPQALSRFAEEFLAPKVRWQEKLRYHVSRAISREGTTWTKPHRRRLVTQGVYLPSYTGFGAGDVVVVVDTSGSIGGKEINRFLSEVDDILSTCNPTSVVLLGCDAAIGAEFFLEAGDSLSGQKIDLKGGGGTCFKPPFKWVEDHGVKPAALIYFTDMYGDFPPMPDYPVMWCRTTDHAGPGWGEIIDVEIE